MSIPNPRPNLDGDLLAFVAVRAAGDCCPTCGRLMRAGGVTVLHCVPLHRGGEHCLSAESLSERHHVTLAQSRDISGRFHMLPTSR
jgi:hypothetical protein